MKFETTSGTVNIPKEEVAKVLLAVCEKRTRSLNLHYDDTDEDSYATRGEIREDLATVASARRDALAGNFNRAFVDLHLDMADAAMALGMEPARTSGNDLSLLPGMAIDELDAEISSLRLSRYLALITKHAREGVAHSFLINRPIQYLDAAERDDHEFEVHLAEQIERHEEEGVLNGFTRSEAEFQYPLGWDPTTGTEYLIVSFLDQPEPNYRLRTREMEYEQDPEEAWGNMIWVDRGRWVTEQKFRSPQEAIRAVIDHIRPNMGHQQSHSTKAITEQGPSVDERQREVSTLGAAEPYNRIDHPISDPLHYQISGPHGEALTIEVETVGGDESLDPERDVMAATLKSGSAQHEELCTFVFQHSPKDESVAVTHAYGPPGAGHIDPAMLAIAARWLATRTNVKRVVDLLGNTSFRPFATATLTEGKEFTDAGLPEEEVVWLSGERARLGRSQTVSTSELAVPAAPAVPLTVADSIHSHREWIVGELRNDGMALMDDINRALAEAVRDVPSETPPPPLGTDPLTPTQGEHDADFERTMRRADHADWAQHFLECCQWKIARGVPSELGTVYTFGVRYNEQAKAPLFGLLRKLTESGTAKLELIESAETPEALVDGLCALRIARAHSPLPTANSIPTEIPNESETIPTDQQVAKDVATRPNPPGASVAQDDLLGPGGTEILAEANARAQRLGLSPEAADAMRDLAMDNVYAENAAEGRRASLEAMVAEDRRARPHLIVLEPQAESQRSNAAPPESESIADISPPLPVPDGLASEPVNIDSALAIAGAGRQGAQSGGVAASERMGSDEPTLTLYRAQTTKSLVPTAQRESWSDDHPTVKNTLKAAGRWFSSDRSETEWYIKNEYFDGADVLAITLPASIAEQFRVSNLPEKHGGKEVPDNPWAFSNRPETEFFLPPELAAIATPVAIGVTWPKDIVASAPARVLRALREAWLDSGGTGDPAALESVRSRAPAEYHALVATNPGEKPLQPLVSVTDGKITLSRHGVEFVNAAIEADPRNGIAQEVAAFYGVPRTSKAPPSTPRREIRAEPASPGPSSTPEIDPMR